MNFNYKNLQFEYSYQNNEFIGDGYVTIPRKLVIEFIKEYSDYDIEEDTPEEVCDFIEIGQDDLIRWLEDDFTEDFTTSDTDLQIIFYNEFLEHEEDITLQVCGENPYWILHDLKHAEHDVSGFDIYVDKYIEEERIFNGLELARELDMLQHVNVDLLKQIEQGFMDRWNYKFDLERGVNYLNDNR